MRQIIFRGKRIDGKGWACGFLFAGIAETYDSYIMPQEVYNGHEQEIRNEWFLQFEKYDQVIPESVGQFIGMQDRNGKAIYEGDIYHQGDRSIRYKVIFDGCGFCGNQIGNKSLSGINHFHPNIQVIGNIHDNPDLLL